MRLGTMSAVGVIVAIVILQLTVSLVVGYATHTDASGTVYMGSVPTSGPNNVLDWGWLTRSMGFAFAITSFQVDGLPALFSMGWNIMTLMVVGCIIRIVWPGGGN